MTPKERIYAILQGNSYDRPAVTPIFMAWAGNFIGRSYRDYYLDGDVLAQAQLAVTRAFNIDQISAISDPWREASAYGMEFEYPPEGVGRPKDVFLKSREDIPRLRPFDIENAERTKQRIESVHKMASEIGQTHSVLGWVEGPLAEYGDLRGVENAMLDLIDRPDLFLEAGNIIVQNAITFAVAQVKAAEQSAVCRRLQRTGLGLAAGADDCCRGVIDHQLRLVLAAVIDVFDRGEALGRLDLSLVADENPAVVL
jgi:uroporphyrinogen-III decarboxylase